MLVFGVMPVANEVHSTQPSEVTVQHALRSPAYERFPKRRVLHLGETTSFGGNVRTPSLGGGPSSGRSWKARVIGASTQQQHIGPASRHRGQLNERRAPRPAL